MGHRIFLATFMLAALAGCSRTPDDQQIRANIKSMQAAVERRSPREFLRFITPDFTGNDNGVDRDGLGNVLRVEVLRNDEVGVTLGPIEVDLQGDRATVHVVATLTGGKGGLIPERGAIYSITSGWRRDGKEWLCYTASWEQKL
jgi:ketosteroid isomerase-like protein